jgi:hypothetical protein
MDSKSKLAFGKINYLLMVAGIVVIAIGYIIMSMDKEEFGFGTLGITIGPIVLLLGFILEVFSIFYKPRKK